MKDTPDNPERFTDAICSPSAGSRWEIMKKGKGRNDRVHCAIQVCSWTPIVEDSKGNACVKYYAGKNRVQCLCYVSEWKQLIRDGRIREANSKDHKH